MSELKSIMDEAPQETPVDLVAGQEREFTLAEAQPKDVSVYLKDGLESWQRRVDEYWHSASASPREFDSQMETDVAKAIEKGTGKILHQDPKDIRVYADSIKKNLEEVAEFCKKHDIALPPLNTQPFDALLNSMNLKSLGIDGAGEVLKGAPDISILLLPFSEEIKRLEKEPESLPSLEQVLEQATLAGISAAYGDVLMQMQQFFYEAMVFQKEYEAEIEKHSISGAPKINLIKTSYASAYMSRDAEANLRLNPPLFITRRIDNLLNNENLELVVINTDMGPDMILYSILQEGLVELPVRLSQKMMIINSWVPSFSLRNEIKIENLERMYPLLHSALYVAYGDSLLLSALDPVYIINEIVIGGDGDNIEVSFKFSEKKRGDSFEKMAGPYLRLLPEWTYQMSEEGNSCRILLKRVR